MGMLYICSSFSHVFSFAWITVIQNQLTVKKENTNNLFLKANKIMVQT